MRTLLVLSLFALIPFGSAYAAADYYLKIDGVEGESTARASATGAAEATVTSVIQSETTVEADGKSHKGEIDLSSATEAEKKKGNVEYGWKVEEAEKAMEAESGERGGTADINIGVGELQNTGIEPDEIDFMGESENATNFGILLGGSGDNEETDEERAQGLERARLVIEENAKASDQAIESVSLNFEKITTRVRHEVRLFGFIPIETTAEVDVDVEQRVAVRFPWWTIFASGDNDESVAERVYSTLSNVLKTKHDTVKNAIQNVR